MDRSKNRPPGSPLRFPGYQKRVVLRHMSQREPTSHLRVSDNRTGTDQSVPPVAAARPVTIVDIARAAGVSKSTVSLVLNGSALVRPETRARVEAAMVAHGYVYNRGAASLRTAASRFVGMIISDVMNPFFAELASGIEGALHDHGYVAILANTNEDLQRQAAVIRMLRENGVAGLIMSPARTTDVRALQGLGLQGLPTVLTMRQVDAAAQPYVGPDNRQGARLATEHLLARGHRRIAFLGGDSTMAARQERLRGHRDVLQAHAMPFDASRVFDAMPTRAGGGLAIVAALDADPSITAALCYNDIVAIGAIRILTERGIAVGQEFAIVGFDDIAEAEHCAPGLTTVSADTRALARRAAEGLLGLISGGPAADAGYIGPARLIERASTAGQMTSASAGKRKLS